MMGKIISLMVQDTKLMVRNAIFWVITVTLILIVLSVHFLIPGDFNSSGQHLVSWNLDTVYPGITPLESREAVEESVRKDGTIGLIQEGDTIILIHPGLSEKTQNALMAALFGEPGDYNIRSLTLRQNTGIIPENIRLAPVFICFEAVVLGFLMAGILMLSEKEQKTIKAYRVSPGGTLAYVISKALVFGIFGTIYALLMAVLIVGFDFNWPGFILLAFVSSVLFTLLGLTVTVFFSDMSNWFFTAVLILVINMTTMVSYSAPAFSPFWIRFIPSYTIIFGFEDVLFGAGRDIAQALIITSAEAAVLFAAACALVRKKLLKAGRSMT